MKPKLDRFLAEWCRKNTQWCQENGISEEDWKKNWKADQEHRAYDYKMRIFAGRNLQSIKEKLPSYFGDLDEPRKNIYYQDDITLEILCFHRGLRKVINEGIETFFVLHNFGTRQNRGIGGFTLKQTTAKDAERILVKWYHGLRIHVYKMAFVQGTSPEGILKCGNMYYQILKSGINSHGVYIKSYLTKYFLERKAGDNQPQRIGGEKRWMKQVSESGTRISPAIGKSAQEEKAQGKVKDYRFIRGMLGVAGNIRYQDGNGGAENISVSSHELGRVPSPIRYKLVENVLFMIPLLPGSDIYKKGKSLNGRRFTFKNLTTNAEGSLSMPILNEEFKMGELMSGYIDYLCEADIESQVGKYARKNDIPLPTSGIGGRKIQKCRGGQS